MATRVNFQVGNLLHFVEVEDEKAATALISNTFTAKLNGRETYQLNASTFVDLRTLNMMKVAKT